MIRTAFAALLLPAFAAAADIAPLVGKPVKGAVVRLDAQVLTAKGEDGKEFKLGVKELASVDLGAKPPKPDDKPYDELELTDGTVLRAASGTFQINGDKAEFAPAGAGEATFVVPLRSIYYLLRDAQTTENRDGWKKLLANRGKRDLLVIRNAGRLDQVEGTVLGGNGKRVEFEQASGEKVSFPLVRFTAGIVFNQPPRKEIPPTLCRVTDALGNTLLAASATFENDGMIVQTVSGATVEYKSLSIVAVLDFRQGNIKHLGDFEPVVQAPKPVEGEPHFTFLRDKTAAGGPLRIGDKIYPKGLWIFPDTTLTFPLNGEYKTFKAVVGVDGAVPIANSAVRVIVEADGRKLFDSKVIRKDAPKELTLDVKDAKELKITVDRDALYAGNQVNLGDARVQK